MSETLSPSEMPKVPREELMKMAQDVAELLTNKGNVRRVGIFGSLARDTESPGDVDFAVLIDEQQFEKYLLTKIFKSHPSLSHPNQIIEMNEMSGVDTKKNFLFEETMGLTREQAKAVASQLVACYKLSGEFPDVALLPNTIQKDVIGLDIKYRKDPTFLSTVMKDYKEYSSNGVFESSPMYGDEEVSTIHEVEFDRLKYLSQRPAD